jgi:hypothetical protein
MRAPAGFGLAATIQEPARPEKLSDILASGEYGVDFAAREQALPRFRHDRVLAPHAQGRGGQAPNRNDCWWGYE